MSAATYMGKPCKRGHAGERYASTGSCYPCAIAAARQWHAGNSERVRARKAAKSNEISVQQSAYHRANRDSITARKRAQYQENPEAARRRTAEWRASNASRARELGREWAKTAYAKCPAKRKATNASRRGAEGVYTAADLVEIRKFQSGRCSYFSFCGADLADGEHVDHVIAIANGGTNWPHNIQLTCPKCNLRKNSKDPLVFLAELQSMKESA
jgi:5-methylcytosine-specific restriction endonuclease McrA